MAFYGLPQTSQEQFTNVSLKDFVSLVDDFYRYLIQYSDYQKHKIYRFCFSLKK